MKNFLIMIFLCVGAHGLAQIAIGKSAVTNSSCLLEFGNEARGIRLPLVTDASVMTISAGSLVFDTATGSFRYYNGTAWSDVVSGGISGGSPSGTDSGDGVIMGSNTTSATGGVLILEATGKALVLPRVNNVDVRMQTPVRGLMVWDTAKKQVAVYNGAKWCFF